MNHRDTDKKRGSTIILSLVMFSILALSMVSFMAFQSTMTRTGMRQRDRLRAFYVAESGIHQVVHWFNRPETYTPDPAKFNRFESTGSYMNENGESRFSSIIVIPENMLPEFRDQEGQYIGKVVSLTLHPPEDEDPSPALCRIESVGEAITGVRRTVVMLVNREEPLSLSCPAAVISLDTSHWGGQFGIHWGEVWSKGDVHLPGISTPFENALSEDPWLAIRSENHLRMNSKKYADGTLNGSPSPLDASAVNYHQPWLDTEPFNRLYQHDTIRWPIFDYEIFKVSAQRRGRYYSTDSDGNIYRDGIEDKAHQTSSWDEEFAMSPDDPYEFVFIDTIDGNPPADDGANLATIRIQGHDTHTKGVFYVAANIIIAGAGNAPAISAHRPDGIEAVITKVRHQGLFICSGIMDQRANNTFYGAVYAGMGYGNFGSPEVYYDARLSDGLFMPITSRVNLTLWKSF